MTHPTSRRSVLGLLGAVPLAGTALAATPGAAHATTAGHAAPARSAPVPKDLLPGGAYDQLIARLAAEDKFSGTVLLAYRGRPVLTRSHGMANRDRSIRNGPHTRFNTASVGKFFTAVAIIQLVAQDKVNLGGTLGSHLDGFSDPLANTITVHQLLTHTSGLGDHRENPDWREASKSWTTPAEVDQGTMAFIRQQQEPLFTPGTNVSYSNSGFWVLGEIVAKVSGQSFWDYVGEHVFAPAGMNRTSYATFQQWQTDDDFAHAYGDPQPNGQRADLTKQMAGIGIGGGDGGAFCTSGDLLRFALALQNGELLSHAHTEMMISGKFPGGQGPFGLGMIAYGTLAVIINDQRKIGHAGGDPGITAHLYSYLDLNWVALVLSNYSVAPIDQQSLLEPLDRLITGQRS